MSSGELDQARGGAQGVRARPRPVLYLVVLAVVIVATFAVHMRQAGIFACPGQAYGGDRYLGYCQGAAYGDFDHGAFWLGLEPAVSEYAAAADVLFVGNSRMQFGFSTQAVESWFDANGLRHYLLGFSNNETSNFIGPMLERLAPRARAYVVNIDNFFVDRITGPAGELMNGGPDARASYVEKQSWQPIHRVVCSRLPAVCGDEHSFYRERETGAWRLDGSRGAVASGIGPNLPVDTEQVAAGKVIGERFIADLGVDRSCVVLTFVPNLYNDFATAQALAEALGFELVSPRLDGLRTFDSSHLDPDSAERFSAAFLEGAGPQLLTCLTGERAAAGASPDRAPDGATGDRAPDGATGDRAPDGATEGAAP